MAERRGGGGGGEPGQRERRKEQPGGWSNSVPGSLGQGGGALTEGEKEAGHGGQSPVGLVNSVMVSSCVLLYVTIQGL